MTIAGENTDIRDPCEELRSIISRAPRALWSASHNLLSGHCSAFPSGTPVPVIREGAMEASQAQAAEISYSKPAATVPTQGWTKVVSAAKSPRLPNVIPISKPGFSLQPLKCRSSSRTP